MVRTEIIASLCEMTCLSVSAVSWCPGIDIADTLHEGAIVEGLWLQSKISVQSTKPLNHLAYGRPTP